MAVAAGFLTTEAAIIAATIVATRVLTPPTYLWAYIVSHCVVAFFGGYLAATLARERGTLHGALVAVLIVALGLLLGAEARRGEPRWYPAVFTFGGAACAVLGGLVCSRLRRHYSSGHYSRPSRSRQS